MAINLKRSHIDEAALLHQIARGIENKMSSSPPINWMGKPLKPAQLVTLFDGYGDVVGAYQTARTTLSQQKAALAAQQAEIRQALMAIHSVVMAAFVNNAAAIEAFGFTPPKTRQPSTAVETVARTTKAAKTRKAVGTLGPAQKRAAIAAAHQAQAVEAAQVAATPGGGSSSASTPPADPAPTVAPAPVVVSASAPVLSPVAPADAAAAGK